MTYENDNNINMNKINNNSGNNKSSNISDNNRDNSVGDKNNLSNNKSNNNRSSITDKDIISGDDKTLIKLLSDMPLTERPYLAIAEQLGLPEDEIINKTKNFLEKGIFRRVALSLDHRKAGILGNTLCMVKVPENKIQETGQQLSQEKSITHCYSRSGLAYSIYFMVHGKSRKESESKAMNILQRLSLDRYDYRMLSSIKEYKKTSFVI